jgi:hypothetical protein
MRVKQIIIEGDTACVIGNYVLRFLNGQKLNGNVAYLDGKKWRATIDDNLF